MTTNTETYSDVWKNCLSQIKSQITDDEFVKWFLPIVPLSYDGNILRLRLPDEESVYHIEHNYIPALRPIIHRYFGNNIRVRYAVPQHSSTDTPTEANTTPMSSYVAQKDTTKIKNPFVIPGIKKLVIDSQLNSKYTFESFVEGACNKLVRSVGEAVAQAPGRTAYNPFYIFGDSGLGKTHLAQAIGLEIKKRHPELQVLYVSMNKFQAQYTTAILNKEPNDFINFYQMIDVLIIDDIQELSGNKSSTQNAFFNIFNHLHLTGKQLILTSDKRPSELSDINDRLLTRFKWGLAAELTPPDYETKVKIILNKARQAGTEIPMDVVEYLAENVNDNVREIEGVLSSLIANADFLKRKLTISLAKEVLKTYVKIDQKEVSISLIRKIVCEHMEISESDLDSPKRTRDIAQARQVAMYLSKKYTTLPLSVIGSSIGGKNHATVLHACKAVNNLLETDRLFAHTMDELERRLTQAR
ncbi:MAG: chromosomal replication initiator protein DnaA [Tidjanibacter sp.]|nr:chromosomal replication initiator protein DnaA [Tidjanibacter sp.]MBR3682144.1 chromosomal replication initiator protein DnaA [Tidjanibacter sp.]